MQSKKEPGEPRCVMVAEPKTKERTNHISQEQLQREVDYARAQQALTSLLANELITLSEFHKITKLNRETFSPFLAEIMP